MRLADCSSDKCCFEFDPHTGVYSHLKLLTPRTQRAGYSGMAQLLRSPREGTVLVAKYLLDREAWFSIGAENWKNLPVDLVPHDLSSLEKQRADFIEMWSSHSRTTGPIHRT